MKNLEEIKRKHFTPNASDMTKCCLNATVYNTSLMYLWEFYKHAVINREQSFTVKESEDCGYAFLGIDVGDARLFYTQMYWKLPAIDINNKLIFFGVVKGDYAYLSNNIYPLGYMTGKINLWKIKNISAKTLQAINVVNHHLYPRLYNSLEVQQAATYDNVTLSKARTELLYHTPAEEITAPKRNPYSEAFIREQDYVDYLCGSYDLPAVIKDLLDSDRESISQYKNKQYSIVKVIQEKASELAEPWELRMADGISTVSDAKFLTVTFEYNGNSATEKINPERILANLINGTCFNYWDFKVQASAVHLLKNLGLPDNQTNKERIYCSDISEIRYGKQIIYKKEI